MEKSMGRVVRWVALVVILAVGMLQSAGAQQVAGYLDFDGVDDYLSANDADSLSFGNGTTDCSADPDQNAPDRASRNSSIGGRKHAT